MKFLHISNKEEISSLAEHIHIDAVIFWEILSPFFKKFPTFKNYKLTFSLTKEQLEEQIYNLPISKKITEDLLSSHNLHISYESFGCIVCGV